MNVKKIFTTVWVLLCVRTPWVPFSARVPEDMIWMRIPSAVLVSYKAISPSEVHLFSLYRY